MEDRYLIHHGIKGQRWGIRRFQNEDGTRTAAGKAREQKYEVNDRQQKKLEKVKNRTLNTIKRRETRDQWSLQRNKEILSELEKGGINSEYAKDRWDSLTDDEKRAAVRRSDYGVKDYATDKALNYLGNKLIGGDVFNSLGIAEVKGREQLLKEDVEELTTINARIVDRGKKYTENYSKLSMTDVNELASKYGYKEAKKQIKSMKKT